MLQFEEEKKHKSQHQIYTFSYKTCDQRLVKNECIFIFKFTYFALFLHTSAQIGRVSAFNGDDFPENYEFKVDINSSQLTGNKS